MSDYETYECPCGRRHDAGVVCAIGRAFEKRRSKQIKDSSLTPWSAHIEVMKWVEAGKYRIVMHRHDGTFRAVDEAYSLLVNADTILLLADELMNWPKCATPFVRGLEPVK